MIFDIQRFAIHDGPGIRTNVFLKGCPLRCWWCQNPEGISSKPQIMYFEYKCLHCHLCVDLCPLQAIRIDKGDVHIIDRELCDGCGKCSDNCPSNALKLVGREYSVEEVMEEIRKDVTFFDSSGGGVTFTGGEPFFQPLFLKGLLEACKAEGIHTVVETSGFVSREILRKLMQYIDLFYHDIKLFDDESSSLYTGVPSKPILDNMRFLSESKRNMVIRFPVIPTITDTEENIRGIAGFLSTLRVEEIHLLPFHDVAEKYARLGMPYKMRVHEAPSRERLKEIKEVFEGIGLKVVLYG
jgi:pyruvate formate lyase activating enzyme